MNLLLFLNIGAPEIIIILLVFGLPLILTVYCLVDITRSTFQDCSNKIIWAIIVLLAPVLGSLIYLVWGRNQKASTEF